jgi:hypothetical protein
MAEGRICLEHRRRSYRRGLYLRLQCLSGITHTLPVPADLDGDAGAEITVERR